MTLVSEYALDLHAQWKERQKRYERISASAKIERLRSLVERQKSDEQISLREAEELEARRLSDLQTKRAVWAARYFAKGVAEALALIRKNENLVSIRIKVSDIQHAAARHYHVTQAHILSTRRTIEVVKPRQAAIFLAKILTPHSLPDIGRLFGRDHTSVLHAVRKISALIKTDPELAASIASIRADVESAAYERAERMLLITAGQVRTAVNAE